MAVGRHLRAIRTGELLVGERIAGPVADLAHTVALAERLVRHVAERLRHFPRRAPAILVELQLGQVESGELAPCGTAGLGHIALIGCSGRITPSNGICNASGFDSGFGW